MNDYVLISKHLVQITIGGLNKTYDQKKKGQRLTRGMVAYWFCRGHNWPEKKSQKWTVFEALDSFKLSRLCELMEWFD
jgi:hypothetical protein